MTRVKTMKKGQVFFFSFNIKELVAKKEIEKINKLKKEVYIIFA